MRAYTLCSGTMALLLVATLLPQVYAQSMSPLENDQDGDGDLLNEEIDLRSTCAVDFTSGLAEAVEGAFGTEMETTLSEDDCNFAMHYLSGQCEEQTTKGVNVTRLCNTFLSDYLKAQDLYTRDFPTDTERFNTILDELKQKEAMEEQERASEEANRPSWAENLE